MNHVEKFILVPEDAVKQRSSNVALDDRKERKQNDIANIVKNAVKEAVEQVLSAQTSNRPAEERQPNQNETNPNKIKILRRDEQKIGRKPADLSSLAWKTLY